MTGTRLGCNPAMGSAGLLDMSGCGTAICCVELGAAATSKQCDFSVRHAFVLCCCDIDVATGASNHDTWLSH